MENTNFKELQEASIAKSQLASNVNVDKISPDISKFSKSSVIQFEKILSVSENIKKTLEKLMLRNKESKSSIRKKFN